MGLVATVPGPAPLDMYDVMNGRGGEKGRGFGCGVGRGAAQRRRDEAASRRVAGRARSRCTGQHDGMCQARPVHGPGWAGLGARSGLQKLACRAEAGRAVAIAVSARVALRSRRPPVSSQGRLRIDAFLIYSA